MVPQALGMVFLDGFSKNRKLWSGYFKNKNVILISSPFLNVIVIAYI